MKTLPFLLSLALLAPGAFAQSFGGDEEAPSAPAPETEDTAPEKNEEEIASETANPVAADPDLINESSRYTGLDIDAYIQAVSSTFDMRSRERDPMGRHQDPNYKPPVTKKPTRKIAKYKKAPVTPFVDIVRAIRITTIMPSKKSFMVGGNRFTKGDKLNLKTSNGKVMVVEVVDVNTNRVSFRNTQTQELADHTVEMLPGGMQRGGSGSIIPAGVSAPDSEILIDVSGAAGPPNNSSRRFSRR